MYTQRSNQPFIRDVFDQFSETRTGGAFTFMTGIGGFLQEFLYGYSGMRWNSTNVALNPSLNGQIGGIVLHNLQWQGQTGTVGDRPTAHDGRAAERCAAADPDTRRRASGLRGRAVTLATRRPDLIASSDLVRCNPVTASSSQTGAPALAAVDGSSATDWEPATVRSTLIARIAGLAPRSGR